MKKIRIAIADDMPHIVERFKLIISENEEFEVVAVAYSAKEAYEAAKRERPDVFLMDIQMETDYAGIEALEKITSEFGNEIKVIMLTMHNDENLIYKSYSLGAVGYILKNSPQADVVNVIHRILNGNYTIMDESAEKLINKIKSLDFKNKSILYQFTKIIKLTSSEREILNLVHKKYTYRQIANARFTEYGTVKQQISRILKKLECSSMKEVIKELEEIDYFTIMGDEQ